MRSGCHHYGARRIWQSSSPKLLGPHSGGGGGPCAGCGPALLARGLDVVLTDKEERLLGNLRVEKDDIFAPRMELYQGASLLYSIRPPLELQIAMGELAAQVGADILIRPLQDEVAELPGFARRLVNAGEARFYLFRGKGGECGRYGGR